MKTLIFSALFLALCVTFSCSKTTATTDFTACETLTYNTGIKELIEVQCNNITCHGANQQPTLTTYAAVKASVENGTFHKEVITSRSMPEGSTLSQIDYDKYNCWINDGAPE